MMAVEGKRPFVTSFIHNMPFAPLINGILVFPRPLSWKESLSPLNSHGTLSRFILQRIKAVHTPYPPFWTKVLEDGLQERFLLDLPWCPYLAGRLQ